MPEGDSPFLGVPVSEWLASKWLCFRDRGSIPVSPGHALVVPRPFIATWWDATEAERADMLALIDEVKRRLDERLHPDGFNVGFNAGAAARHVIPGEGNYLEPARVAYGLVDGQDRLLRDELLRRLRDVRFNHADILSASL